LTGTDAAVIFKVFLWRFLCNLVDSPCETVNFLGTRTPQITVQHDLAEKLILLLGFVLLLYMLLMYVVLIVNIMCDDELDICRKFHEFNLQGIGIKGKKLVEEQVNELKSFSKSLKVLPTAAGKSTNR